MMLEVVLIQKKCLKHNSKLFFLYTPFHFYFKKKTKRNLKIKTDVVKTNTVPSFLILTIMELLPNSGYSSSGAKEC